MIARLGLVVVAALLYLDRPARDAVAQAPAASGTATASAPSAVASATASATSAVPTAPTADQLRASAERDQRDFLSAEGIDPPLMARFKTGKPYDDEERRPLIVTLAAMKKLSPSDAARFALAATGRATFADLFANGRMLSVRGKLRSIKSEKFDDEELARVYPEVDEMAADDPRRTFYRIELEAEGAEQVTAFSLAAPRALVGRPSLDEPGGVTGLYLKHAGAAAGERPLLAATHVAWYPDTALGRLGMDMALFDDIREYSADLKLERECFYQLLSAMRRADLDKLLDETNRQYSAVPLFNDPNSVRGTLVALEGKARRAAEVRVSDADIRSRFGIERYYQVEIFTRDSQSNPIIFNLAELPAGFPVGESISQDVRIPGVYLTGFAYDRDATVEEREQNEKPKMQKAPLLIGRSLEMIDYEAGAAPEWLFGAIVVGAVFVLGIGAWLWSRNQGTARRIRQQVDEQTTGKSLNDLPLEYRSKPDFSNLEERDRR